jgi:HlyB family type I secretion system ABC transporter
MSGISQTLIQEFLTEVSPFNQLPPKALAKMVQEIQPLRYRMGQGLLPKGQMPAQITILYEGQVRLLAYDPRTQSPVTIQLLQPGAVMGVASWLRKVPCEPCIASTEVVAFNLEAKAFLAWLDREKGFANAAQHQASLVEVFEVLGTALQNQANASADLKTLALELSPQAQILYLPTDQNTVMAQDPEWEWFVSNQVSADWPVGATLEPATWKGGGLFKRQEALRLIGFQRSLLPWYQTFNGTSDLSSTSTAITVASSNGYGLALADIPYAPEHPDQSAVPVVVDPTASKERYPFIRAQGSLDSATACFQMLCQHLGMPFRREVIRRVLVNQYDRTGSISLQLCGAVGELIGLQAQLVSVPLAAVGRLPMPAIVRWEDGFALLYTVNRKTSHYGLSAQQTVAAIPELGLVRKKTTDFLPLLAAANQLDATQPCQVLLLKPTAETPQQRFGLSWFTPSLQRHWPVLVEVLLASFFVQLFSLANPLMIQVIIDSVLLKNSGDTLQILGIFLLGVAAFEAILSTLRTYLFTETTNRIDLALGSEIIDHLLRLPLRYFDRRPVGELSTRVNELENIRRFLTGTALTVVLDAVFSVVYIVVMVIYSWQLTLVALATVPLFLLMTLVVAPIVRRQLRVKAEHNAQTQSYLVEVLSGIQTVKAQNIELRARWQWQERYARYVSTGFKTVQTATAASAISTFLNQLSGLLVIWVGAYLVLSKQLSLGQLIAFRIIANYVTTPLLRLAQIWQSFQEVGLSLERLSDIIDTPQEVEAIDRGNIPMPLIKGDVCFDQVVFQYNPSRAPQLHGINLDVKAGTFVGVVGQSGSGKSTLLKLLARLYEPTSGRILVDNFDIAKVELYSLRQQIGIVPQDTLLFDGSVQENIALTNPDASTEEIIEMARLAAAHDFIMNLPNGYNTPVGERGASLSGGQRQRVAIARTLLQNPRLLIMDEATSALDYETERQVCQNLMECLQHQTVFFITHRLGTIRNADVILMMDQGTIVEQGTHPELMALKGRYYCLYQQQEAQL